ncbi:hypothetical protein H6G36_14560 [Anabaena minutissima FACHB-250]|nr:hypothetical protein [Anabaena minutissima FACHB-250]
MSALINANKVSGWFGRCISGGENPLTRANASQPKIAAKCCCHANICNLMSGMGVDGITA